jgi:hypothetical protein
MEMHLLLLHSTKAQLPTRDEDEHEVKRLVGHEKRWKRQILHEDSPAPRIAQETLERQPCRLHFCYSSHEWTPQRPFLQIYLRDWRAAPPSLINDRNYSSVSSLACGRTSSRKMYWPLACVLDKQSRAGHALQFAHFVVFFAVVVTAYWSIHFPSTPACCLYGPRRLSRLRKRAGLR